MSEFENLSIHHGGHWESADNMVYIGGEVVHMKNVDIDYLSVFELQGYAKDLGYRNSMLIWFKITGLSGNESYEEIETDVNVSNMLDYNRGCDFIELFFVEVDEPLSVDYGSGKQKWSPSMSNVPTSCEHFSQELSDDVDVVFEDGGLEEQDA